MAHTAQKKPIEKIHTMIQYANYPASLVSIPESTHFHIWVGPGHYMSSPGAYDSERQVIMDVAFMNDVFQSVGIAPNPQVDYLKFMLELPFEVPEDKVSEVFELLSFFNLIVPLGCFCVNENRVPYFKYEHLVRVEQEIEARVLIEILNTLMFFIEILGYKIEALAKGEKDLDALLNEQIHFDNRPQKTKGTS